MSIEFHEFDAGLMNLQEVRVLTNRVKRAGFYCVNFHATDANNLDVLFINQNAADVAHFEYLWCGGSLDTHDPFFWPG